MVGGRVQTIESARRLAMATFLRRFSDDGIFGPACWGRGCLREQEILYLAICTLPYYPSPLLSGTAHSNGSKKLASFPIVILWAEDSFTCEILCRLQIWREFLAGLFYPNGLNILQTETFLLKYRTFQVSNVVILHIKIDQSQRGGMQSIQTCFTSEIFILTRVVYVCKMLHYVIIFVHLKNKTKKVGGECIFIHGINTVTNCDIRW